MFSKIFQSIKLIKNIQEKSNGRNRAALNCLKDQGFPLSGIRRALIVLNGISYADIAGDRTSVASVSNTVNGLRQSKEAVILICEKLGLEPEELF